MPSQALCNWWLLAGTCAVLPPRRPACPDAGFSVLAGASAASPPIAIAISLFRVHSYSKSWVIGGLPMYRHDYMQLPLAPRFGGEKCFKIKLHDVVTSCKQNPCRDSQIAGSSE